MKATHSEYRVLPTSEGDVFRCVFGSNIGVATSGEKSSGRGATQLTGQCRGRTHVPIALTGNPALRPCLRDRENEQRKTTHCSDWPTIRALDRSNEAAHGARWVINNRAQRHSRMPRVALLPKKVKA